MTDEAKRIFRLEAQVARLQAELAELMQLLSAPVHSVNEKRQETRQ